MHGAARLGFWFNKITPAPPPGQTDINYLADFVVLTYAFGGGGRDLDTRTRIVSPFVAPDYLGWAHGVATANLLFWGGDNTGTGYESVYLDCNAYRAAYPTSQTIVIDCRCEWYGQDTSYPVVLDATLYKGGSMQNSSYQWVNPAPTGMLALSSQSKSISLYTQDASTQGERLAVFTYNVFTGVGNLDINNTSLPVY